MECKGVLERMRIRFFHRGALALMALVLALALPAASLGETVFAMAGFDGDDATHDWATNGFFTRMQQRTGVAFTFEQYNDYQKWTARKTEMFATGELPDVFFKAELTTDELIRYTDSGQLIDLKPLLEANAPNLWALLQEHPDWLAAITLPSGKIGALPTLTERPSQNAMWINQTWLDALGLETPTDAAGLREVLEAFRTRDPNRNGQRDEIPLTFNGVWDLKFLLHAYGLIANDYNICLDDAGQVRFVADQDAFFEALSWIKGLWDDGLLYEYGFSTADTIRTVTDENASEIYGVMLARNPMTLIPYKQSKDYRLLMPLQYNGKQVYRDFFGSVVRGTFAITSKCEDPAALLAWVDTLYSQEGAIEAYAGAEGVDYRWNADGTWSFVQDEATVSAAITQLVIYDTGSMPWLFPTGFDASYHNDDVKLINDQLDALAEVVVRPFPEYTLTAEQREWVVAKQNVLGLYVDEYMGRWIQGQIPLDAESIAEYKLGLEERGLSEFVAFWQQIADGLETGGTN